MQQYLIHLEKTGIVIFKKSIVMCFYPSKTNNGQTPKELYIKNVQM
jgi:hypothetical protein